MGRELEVNENQASTKGKSGSSETMLDEVRGQAYGKQTSDSPEKQASEKSAAGILSSLDKGKEDEAKESLYQIWKKNQHGDKSQGDFQDVVKKLEDSTKSKDMFHKVETKRFDKDFNNAAAYEVRVGIESPIGIGTHKLFDLSEAVARDKAETEAAEAAKAAAKQQKGVESLWIPNVFEQILKPLNGK